jgi:CheY-like chemotaxis protein
MMEALGIRFVLATTTEEALEKLNQQQFDAIISDMGRPPDPRAGYTLLDRLRSRRNQTPFIIYSNSRDPEHIAESRRHGAIGCTNDSTELIEMVLSAIGWVVSAPEIGQEDVSRSESLTPVDTPHEVRRAEELAQTWRSRLQASHPNLSSTDRDSIVSWLLGEDVEQFDQMDAAQFTVAKQAMDYRYRILQQQYLGVQPEQAYRQLIQRLGSLFLIRNEIKAWVALSRDRQRTVIDVLQEVIQELIQSDNYIRQQTTWISQCTNNPRLRNSLLLATVEEYCLRPIRNQPLLVYRFVNHLRRSQRGGMTEVPTGELIRLVSEDIFFEESEEWVNLIDQAIGQQYQEHFAVEEE